jgi:hypothetical protein
MNRNNQTRGRTRILSTVAIAATAGALALTGAAVADAAFKSVPPPPAAPTSADQIQNIDQVKTAIKAYYGDTLTGQVDPVPNSIDGADVVLHTFSPAGAYANEVAGIETDAATYLGKVAKQGNTTGTPAIIFDVDDTTLNTYNYEIYSNFVYNPTTNAAFVNSAAFPAVPGMPALASWAAARGYDIFFLTGRPESQRPGTVTNLTNVGFATPTTDHLFLKDQTLPWLASCAPTCTSAQYKALTRQHLIEDLGYDIVANFGDQPSDFTGGFEDLTIKMPNPMYYLP